MQVFSLRSARTLCIRKLLFVCYLFVACPLFSAMKSFGTRMPGNLRRRGACLSWSMHGEIPHMKHLDYLLSSSVSELIAFLSLLYFYLDATWKAIS